MDTQFYILKLGKGMEVMAGRFIILISQVLLYLHGCFQYVLSKMGQGMDGWMDGSWSGCVAMCFNELPNGKLLNISTG